MYTFCTWNWSTCWSSFMIMHVLSLCISLVLFCLFRYWYREQEANFEQTKRKLQTELDSITFLKESIQRQKESLEGEVSAKTIEVTGLKSTVTELQTAQVGIAAQLDATKVCNCCDVLWVEIKYCKKIYCLLRISWFNSCWYCIII